MGFVDIAKCPPYDEGMSDILSKDEIDALMAEVAEDDDEGGLDEGEELAPDSMEMQADASVDEPLPDDLEDEPPLDDLDGPSDLDDLGGGPLAVTGDSENLELILSIPVEVSVELGRARMSIFDLLQLGQGAVIELDKMASELVDLTVDQRLLAKGEAVVINENFGFRCLKVESVVERIRRL